MQRLILLLTALLTSALYLYAASPQETLRRVRYKDGPAYIYRIQLTDKKGTGYSLEKKA